MTRRRSRRSTAGLRALGRVLLVVVGIYLVGRALVEVVTVDPTDPAGYRHDWGGPSYVGVLLVHAGPGAVVVALAARRLRRRSADPSVGVVPATGGGRRARSRGRAPRRRPRGSATAVGRR